MNQYTLSFEKSFNIHVICNIRENLEILQESKKSQIIYQYKLGTYFMRF